MSDRTAPPKPPKRPRDAEKPSRLAAALRANLARRKARARAGQHAADPKPIEDQG